MTRIHSAGTRALKSTLGCISLATLALGLAINWFAGEAGLPIDMANAAAFGMLLTAVAHAVALYMWDRH